MERVDGAVAFITGGASGMGLGMAQVFSRAGMRVVIADIRQEALDAALSRFPADNPGVFGVQLDVADRAAYVRAADAAEAKFGKIHVLVNNAGIGIVGSLLTATYADWDWGLAVNLGGVINGIQTILPRIRRHGEAGHILTTSSMSGIFAAGVAGIYTTAKYAVVGLMESLRSELEPHSIGVSAFCPGLVNTNIGDVDKLRPAEFRDSTYSAGAAERAAFMREKLFPHGMSPIEIGERVLEGIRRNDLWILTHSEYREGAQQRFDAILASFPTDAAPPQRAAAEAMVLRNPLFAAERERRSAHRKPT
ncbi:MAG TPA: SDR family NAD(P)-dependent oxidoreductase [Steroidobacteraceae bacterium]